MALKSINIWWIYNILYRNIISSVKYKRKRDKDSVTGEITS